MCWAYVTRWMLRIVSTDPVTLRSKLRVRCNNECFNLIIRLYAELLIKFRISTEDVEQLFIPQLLSRHPYPKSRRCQSQNIVSGWRRHADHDANPTHYFDYCTIALCQWAKLFKSKYSTELLTINWFKCANMCLYLITF